MGCPFGSSGEGLHPPGHPPQPSFGNLSSPDTRQVIHDFVSELEVRSADDPKAAEQVVQERAGRQTAFLKRSRGEVVPNASLRPKTMYRKSALQWISALNNQVALVNETQEWEMMIFLFVSIAFPELRLLSETRSNRVPLS